MSPWTGQGWKQLLLCPRGITLLPEVSKDILGSAAAIEAATKHHSHGEMEPAMTNVASPASSQSS